MLSAQQISISYGEREVLSGITFDLRPRQTIALLGPNGAGKTTLIKALNGTVPLTRGVVELNGRSIDTLSRREIAANIAVVAQENETSFPVSVLEFVLSGRFVHGGAFGWESEEDIDLALNALKETDLLQYEQRLMNNLSGGERQRVVLARALATNADILLLDEPTANLDLAHQAMMFRLVRKRCDEAESSAVVITHDLNLAAEFADEVLMLQGKKVAARGRPADVLTAENIKKVFSVDVMLDRHPVSGSVRVTSIY